MFYQRLYRCAPRWQVRIAGNLQQIILQSIIARTKAQVFFKTQPATHPGTVVSSINIMDSTPKSAG
jgi:hypothetical protein